MKQQEPRILTTPVAPSSGSTPVRGSRSRLGCRQVHPGAKARLQHPRVGAAEAQPPRTASPCSSPSVRLFSAQGISWAWHSLRSATLNSSLSQGLLQPPLNPRRLLPPTLSYSKELHGSAPHTGSTQPSCWSLTHLCPRPQPAPRSCTRRGTAGWIPTHPLTRGTPGC